MMKRINWVQRIITVSAIGVLLVFCFTFSHAEIDQKYYGFWVDTRDQKLAPEEQALVDQPAMTRPELLRKGAKNDITNLRNSVEDELRIYVLAFIWEDDKIQKVKSILNKPWDTEGINTLWQLTFGNAPEWKGVCGRKQPLLNLFVYITTNYKNNEINELIKEKFDAIAKSMQDEKPEFVHVKNPKVVQVMELWCAIAEYGSLALISNTMLQTVEKTPDDTNSYPIARSFLEIFAAYPSEESINQLKNLFNSLSWDKNDDRRKYLEQIVKWNEMLLRYPVLKVFKYTRHINDLLQKWVKQADTMQESEQDRTAFLEKQIEGYVNDQIKRANELESGRIFTKQGWIKEANQIKNKLKIFRTKEKQNNAKDSPDQSDTDKPKDTPDKKPDSGSDNPEKPK
ncbi:MAG: hypothetical protein HY811_09815 [Planctomycetes bacterium]|nr:hypothetical protein [Planctomycetota bacterium]